MTMTTARVRAPELIGAGGWINTEAPLSLAGLRGRVVLLDFWTFCCINCLRVIEELRPLEHRFGAALVIIGVHSPKFPHEGDHRALERAVRRHRIEHPVLDDPDMQTWQRYGVRAWPTLVVIDQDGYVVAHAAGEGNGAALGEVIGALLEGRPAPPNATFAAAPPAASGTLSYPGKVASDGAGHLAIADTGHDRVLLCDLDGAILRSLDGFHQPQGVRFDRSRLVVCDTVAGELVEAPLNGGPHRVLATGMRSPWDVLVLPDSRLVVAEAGLHRLLAVPGEGGEPLVLAGTRAEGLRDGPAASAHLAQPSGLTLLDDGAIAFADSEVSALRVLRGGNVVTLAGAGLFEWGADDGDAATARLQHPLAVAALGGGAIAVADTFNSRLRIWRDGSLTTLAVDTVLDEPGGIDVLSDGRLVVADTNNHRVVIVDPASGHAVELRLEEPGDEIRGAASTSLTLEASVDLDGEDLDHAQGPPVRVSVAAAPDSLLAPGPRSWTFDGLPAAVTLSLGTPGTGTLVLDVIASTCHDDVCTIRRRRRRHALTVDADGG